MERQNDVAQPMLVVLGLDASGKARASRFTPGDSEQAMLAARLMDLHAVNISEAELRAVAMVLPIGKIFATGRGLVPFVKRELYDKLAVLIGTEVEVKDATLDRLQAAHVETAKPTKAAKPMNGEHRALSATSAPTGVSDQQQAGSPTPSNETPGTDPWAAIRIGTTVLARSAEAGEGWFEAVVSSIAADGNELTLRWRDFAGELVFKRKRQAVGVLAS
jgi:hypothetical protein